MKLISKCKICTFITLDNLDNQKLKSLLISYIKLPIHHQYLWRTKKKNSHSKNKYRTSFLHIPKDVYTPKYYQLIIKIL